MRGLEVNIAPRSMVLSTDFDAGFNSRAAPIFCFCTQRFWTVRRFLTVYDSSFARTASGGSCGGLTIFLHIVGGSRVTNGIRSGWGQVRVG